MIALRIAAIALLLFNGVGAIYGGATLMSDPSGSMLGLPISYLEDSPFTNYFFPGLILFIANGILSLLVMLYVIMQWKNYQKLIILQGVVLLIWLLTQAILLHMLVLQHYIMGVTGLLLIILGIILERKKILRLTNIARNQYFIYSIIFIFLFNVKH